MVIDDSEPDQFFVSILLQKLSQAIDVVQVFDGQEALDMLILPGNQPDIIFLDINMPGMDGFEFLEKYSKLSAQHVEVVLLSSSENISDKKRALAYDFVKKYLTKPFDISLFDELGYEIA